MYNAARDIMIPMWDRFLPKAHLSCLTGIWRLRAKAIHANQVRSAENKCIIQLLNLLSPHRFRIYMYSLPLLMSAQLSKVPTVGRHQTRDGDFKFDAPRLETIGIHNEWGQLINWLLIPGNTRRQISIYVCTFAVFQLAFRLSSSSIHLGIETLPYTDSLMSDNFLTGCSMRRFFLDRLSPIKGREIWPQPRGSDIFCILALSAFASHSTENRWNRMPRIE